MRARYWAGVALGGVALTGALALPMTASADVTAEGVSPCVRFSLNDDGWVDKLTIKNTCGRSKHVKVKLAHKKDSPCFFIRPKQTKVHTWSYPGRFDGLDYC